MNIVINNNTFWSRKEVIIISSLFIIYSIIIFIISFLIESSIELEFSQIFLIIHIGISFFIFIIFSFFRKKNLSYLSFNFSLKWFLISVLLIFVIVVFDVFVLEIMDNFLNNETVDQSNVLLSDNFWLNILNFYIFGSILIPFIEELIFKGLIFKYIRQSREFVFSALISSLMFAMIHLDIQFMIFQFLFSIVTVFVFEKTDSIFYPFLIHVGVNVIFFSTLYV